VAKQKFALGRGLDALITGAKDVMAPQESLSSDEHSILEAALDSIIPNPRQPRRAFRDDDPKLLELSASIKEYGLLQPLIVTRLDTPPSGRVPGTTPKAGGAGAERRGGSGADEEWGSLPPPVVGELALPQRLSSKRMRSLSRRCNPSVEAQGKTNGIPSWPHLTPKRGGTKKGVSFYVHRSQRGVCLLGGQWPAEDKPRGGASAISLT
jgi:ParB-like nuclease domain